MDLASEIKALSQKLHADMIAWRRTIHANPELAFEETNTSEFISALLTSWGVEHQTGVAKTGIVAYIKGELPSDKVVALRADMDALPILEQNEVEYASKNSGKMHACGHDVHSASLLGAANILQELRASFSGKIKLIFQPAEEKLPGGASVMIEEGVLQNPKPESIFGQHVFPDLPAGKVGFRSGMYMASADEVYITIRGKGGHAAMPHRNIDPILIASHVVVALQQLVSRNANPSIPSVLTIGKIEGGTATNITPSEVKMEGTFRTFNEAWRKEAHQKIEELVNSLTKSMGGSADIAIKVGYPFLKNDEELTPRSKIWAEEYLGAENVVDLPIRMTAEDFAFYTHHVPGCFYRLGTASQDGNFTSPVHTPTFNIDESALQTGSGLMAYLAVKALGN